MRLTAYIFIFFFFISPAFSQTPEIEGLFIFQSSKDLKRDIYLMEDYTALKAVDEGQNKVTCMIDGRKTHIRICSIVNYIEEYFITTSFDCKKKQTLTAVIRDRNRPLKKYEFDSLKSPVSQLEKDLTDKVCLWPATNNISHDFRQDSKIIERAKIAYSNRKYSELKRLASAEIINFGKTSSFAYSLRANAHFKHKEIEPALKDIESAKELGIKSVFGYITAFNIYKHLGRHWDAHQMGVECLDFINKNKHEQKYKYKCQAMIDYYDKNAALIFNEIDSIIPNPNFNTIAIDNLEEGIEPVFDYKKNVTGSIKEIFH